MRHAASEPNPGSCVRDSTTKPRQISVFSGSSWTTTYSKGNQVMVRFSGSKCTNLDRRHGKISISDGKTCHGTRRTKRYRLHKVTRSSGTPALLGLRSEMVKGSRRAEFEKSSDGRSRKHWQNIGDSTDVNYRELSNMRGGSGSGERRTETGQPC